MNKFLLIPLFILSSLSINAQSIISKTQAEAMADAAIAKVMDSNKSRAAADWAKKEITIKDKNLKFSVQVYGQAPLSGRSLYISMHGGGNGPASMNDQQWSNQIKLYAPKEGVYVAPRAPTNTWNLWHEDHIDDLFEQLIQDAILMEGVNPNKVYVMGYSAGGDGTFQLAPRMADHWAAAAMMAGHPGDASALNLRNLPFAIYMGGEDAAYNRNKLAAAWGKRLDSLEALSPKHFIHDVQIYPGLPHWMSRKDTVAIGWMSGFTRNPLPSTISWHQDDRLRSRFYWLGLPEKGRVAHAEAEVSIIGNTIEIKENEHPELYLYLNDRLLNLDQKVKVIYKGKVLYNARVKRSQSIIEETASRMDRDLVFSARLRLSGTQISVG